MGHITALVGVLLRLCRPSQGVHVSPFGYLRELHAEARAELAARRRRASRVRRYAREVPTVALSEPPTAPTPIVPAPRVPADDLPHVLRPVPADYVPVVDPREVAEPAAIIRPYYLDYERRRAQEHADRQRLAVDVLIDIANAASRAEVAQ